MNEIEYRLEHAHWLRQRLLEVGPDCRWVWCDYTGLWETSIWTYDNLFVDKMMKELNPGQRNERN